MTAVLTAPVAHAQVVQYTIAGDFTGLNSGDSALTNAIGPSLGTQAFTLALSIDASASAAPVASGGSLYRALSGTSMSFAGFTDIATNGCTSSSEFICTVQVRNGTGLRGTGGDQYLILSDIGRSAAFNSATGEARILEFQFILYLSDYTGALLADESVGLDLAQQSAAAFGGSLAVFARGQNGFDRADFGVRVSAITRNQPPDPPAAAVGQDRPTRQPTLGARVQAEGTDLVITRLDLDPTALRQSKASSGGNTVQIQGLMLAAQVSNRGKVSWASDGVVAFTLRPGKIDETATPQRPDMLAPGVRVPSPSKQGTPRQADPAFRVEPGKIPGSIAPGRSSLAQGRVGTVRGESVVVLEAGKFYTVTATIRAAGETNNGNNTSARAFRMEREREGLKAYWEPLRIQGAGTETVKAPR